MNMPSRFKLKPQIQMHSGKYFDFLEPEKSDFTITDIAWALSNICRYTGHCGQFYSVAEHSVRVSRIVPREHALAGLLHDAAEAFIGDVSSPLKQMLPDYRALEQRIERAVLGRFGITELHHCIKEADLRMLLAEKRDLMPICNESWAIPGIVADRTPIHPWGSHPSYIAFLDTFNALSGV